MTWRAELVLFAEKGITIASGLTSGELERVESVVGDLASYLRCEFHGLRYQEAVRDGARKIRFWSELAS